MKVILISFLLSVFLIGCQAKAVFMRPPLENTGKVHIYMQPFPAEADRISFIIEKVSVLKGDGIEYPLDLFKGDFGYGSMKTQRLMASGEVPPGEYSALVFQVGKASLKAEGGEAALLLPEGTVKVEFPMSVVNKESLVLRLSFIYGKSVAGIRFAPSFSVSVPPMPLTGLIGYVSNLASNNVTVFDKIAGQVAAVIETGKWPAGMALDPVSRRAYIALSGDDMIDVIDITSGKGLGRIRLAGGDGPQALALTPDAKTLLAGDIGSETVSIMDPFSFIETARVKVGKRPVSLLIDSTGKRAYVFNNLSNTISVLDIPNKAVSATVSTEFGPLRGQLNRRGDRLYVIHDGSPYLLVLDPASLTVLKKVFIGPGAQSIKVDSNTDMIYIGKRNDVLLEVYDPFSFVPVELVNAGGPVTYMTRDGERNTLYMILQEKREIKVIDLISRKVISEIDIGDEAYWVTLMGER